jgi:uncharacterized protein YidB (DUF937 family)
MQQFGKQGQGQLIQGLIGMIGGGGGLGSLLGKFQSAGLGNKAQSWVSGQTNESLSGQEVRQALGNEQVEQMAQQSGMSSDDAADSLAGIIPDTVNELTPDGQIPDQTTMQQRLGGLAGKIPGL